MTALYAHNHDHARTSEYPLQCKIPKYQNTKTADSKTAEKPTPAREHATVKLNRKNKNSRIGKTIFRPVPDVLPSHRTSKKNVEKSCKKETENNEENETLGGKRYESKKW